jgi:protein involved in polysaccharide export with SLBB domain
MVGTAFRSRRVGMVFVFLPFLLAFGGGCAANRPAESDWADGGLEIIPGAVPPTAEDLLANPAGHILGPTDVLDITIMDLFQAGVETALRREVSDAGFIDLPLLPNRVKADGLTADDLRRAIVRAYEPSILAKAAVTVTVVKGRAETFSIIGAVQRQGTYNILREDMRLLEALALAGDVTYSDLRFLYVIRRIGPFHRPEASGTHGVPGKDMRMVEALALANGQSANTRPADPRPAEAAPGAAPTSRLIAIDYRRLSAGDARQNIVIRDNDVINVPRPPVGEFYVAGEVHRPGVYSMTGRNITVRMAIIAAGLGSVSGYTSCWAPASQRAAQTTAPASFPKGRLFRKTPAGGYAPTALDIEAILNGTAADITLKPYDVIAVGDAKIDPAAVWTTKTPEAAEPPRGFW